jgi:YfiH family protein
MPVLLIDPRKRAVAAAHAGWRGALTRLVEKTVGEMRREFGSRPRDILAAVGPSIRACCYEVGEEVHDAFSSRFAKPERFFRKPTQPSSTAERYPLGFLAAEPPGHGTADAPRVHLDLAAVARAQLEDAGVPLANIDVAEFCTACRTDLFFSHRREGSRTGRLMAVIGIRP